MREDLREAVELPTLETIIAHYDGVFIVRQGVPLSGFQRQMYMSGLVALEVDSEGTPLRAFANVVPVEAEAPVEG